MNERRGYLVRRAMTEAWGEASNLIPQGAFTLFFLHLMPNIILSLCYLNKIKSKIIILFSVLNIPPKLRQVSP